MAELIEETFITSVNENMKIVQKVCSVYSRHDIEERKDLFQEMLYQLWKAYPSFKGNAKFSTWMYRVCLNIAITWLKKVKKGTHERLSDINVDKWEYEIDNQEENIKLLYEAIEKLSSVNKAIILLYLEEMSYQEMAEITGLSKSNVSVRLVRIKQQLENELTDKVVK